MKDEEIIALVFVGVLANALLPVFFKAQNLAFILAGVAMCAFLTQIREIRAKPTRSFLLVVAGLSSFWLTGAALVQSDISLDIWPIFVFAISTVQTVLVAYTMGAQEGLVFGVTALIFSASGLNFGNSTWVFRLPVDKLMIISILTAGSEAVWAWLVGNSEQLQDSLVSVVKGALIGGALNAFSFFMQYDSSKALHITWFYLLSHVLLVSVFILLHEFMASTYNMRREVTEAGVKYRAKLAVEEAISEEEAAADPYSSLIGDMQEFEKSPPKNKLVATQTIARFRNEFSVMSSKYDTPSKKQAEKLLQKIGG